MLFKLQSKQKQIIEWELQCIDVNFRNLWLHYVSILLAQKSKYLIILVMHAQLYCIKILFLYIRIGNVGINLPSPIALCRSTPLLNKTQDSKKEEKIEENE
jgi:hypothetical protein